MARIADPDSDYKVSSHKVGKYVYATTQPAIIDPETGKKTHKHKTWGTLEGNMFIPGKSYRLASPEVRARLIFPDGWDMTEANRYSGNKSAGRPAYVGEASNRFYGDIWLLEHIADDIGIRQDLERVFSGNTELVDDIMTLAMYPYLSGMTYNRLARNQRLFRYPSDTVLTSPIITAITQSITETHRSSLLKLRSNRIGKDELCAIDSTSRSAYGRSLVDIRWGKNKDHLPLAQTVEVVVYSMSSHLPVYYRSFPGNMPDSRSLEVIRKDLERAGFEDYIMITDRGYYSLKNLEKIIWQGQKMLMFIKTDISYVYDAIRGYGEYNDHPGEMTIDKDTRLYYQQFELEYTVEGNGKSEHKADRLYLDLYLDTVRRSEELAELEVEILTGQEELEDKLRSGEEISEADEAAFKRRVKYFKYTLTTTRQIKSYEKNEKKIQKAKQLSGFFSLLTHKLDYAPMEAFQTYRLRDEQEKYFQQMKDQMGFDKQGNWSEEGKAGRLFISFVGLMLSSQVRHVWKTTELHEQFDSSLAVLDEMRSIRCIEQEGKSRIITPFVGAQIDICKAFGFDIPEGCSPEYVSRKNGEKRRGRPRKRAVEIDS